MFWWWLVGAQKRWRLGSMLHSLSSNSLATCWWFLVVSHNFSQFMVGSGCLYDNLMWNVWSSGARHDPWPCGPRSLSWLGSHWPWFEVAVKSSDVACEAVTGQVTNRGGSSHLPGLVNIQKAMENGDLTNKETVRLWWFYGDLMVILLSNRFGKWWFNHYKLL